jgi:hypothetical protein
MGVRCRPSRTWAGLLRPACATRSGRGVGTQVCVVCRRCVIEMRCVPVTCQLCSLGLCGVCVVNRIVTPKSNETRTCGPGHTVVQKTVNKHDCQGPDDAIPLP